MLYTRKGDDGTTKTFGCNQRISKSSEISEALGTLDELNSFLGFVKIKAISAKFKKERTKNKKVKISFEKVLHEVQQNLFIVQAETAGADKRMNEKKIADVEEIIADIEKVLPPIKTFIIPNGAELSTLLDFSRTLARRAERRIISVSEKNRAKIGKHTLAYLNRLSSLLYALARLANYKRGMKEEAPSYK